MLKVLKKVIYSVCIFLCSMMLISCGDDKFESKVDVVKSDYKHPALTPRLLQDLAKKNRVSRGDRVIVFGFLQMENSVGHLYEYKDLSKIDECPFYLQLLLESYVDNDIPSLKECDGKYSEVTGEASFTLGVFSIKNITDISCYESKKF